MHIHAKYLRPFGLSVDQLSCNCAQLNQSFHYSSTCNDCSIIYDDVVHFGDIKVVEPQ